MKKGTFLIVLLILLITNIFSATVFQPSSLHIEKSEAKIAEIKDKAAYMLPKGNPLLAGKYVAEGVNDCKFYSSEPAPMGIADCGIGPNGPYILETTQFKGVIYIYDLFVVSYWPNRSVLSYLPYGVSFQLNVVLSYKYKGYSYALWLQNVLEYDTQTHEAFFVDNIWNFSAPFANVNSVSGNGYIGYVDSSGHNVSFYYYETPTISLLLPAVVELLINVTTNKLGQPVIYFWYNYGDGWVNYDTVTVTNVISAKDVYLLVNGYQRTGSGNFYDAELVMAGPSNGAIATIQTASVYLALEYWNGYNFQAVRNAYNFGSNTAETSENVIAEAVYFTSNGLPLVYLTAGYGDLGQLWNQNQLTTLVINTGVSSGYVAIYNASLTYPQALKLALTIPFVNSEVILSLYPMTYAILVYDNNGNLVGEANVYAIAGETTFTDVTQFKVSISPIILKVFQGGQTVVNIKVNAYGYVNVSLYVGQYLVYTNLIYVSGSSTMPIMLYIHSTATPGNYTILVVATLFPGFSQKAQGTLTILPSQVTLQLSYQVIGQPLPYPLKATLIFPNGTSSEVSLVGPILLKLPYGTILTLPSVINGYYGYRWATPNSTYINLTEASIRLLIIYYEQVKVSFQYSIIGGGGYYIPPSVTFYYFGTPRTFSVPTTAWVDYGSSYNYPQLLLGSDSNERWISYNYFGEVTSPGTIIAIYYHQYYVNVISPIPVYALVNGVNSSLASGWYDSGTTIQIENISYYKSSLSREVITSVTPSTTITVNSPITIRVSTVTQYYVNVTSPIPVRALVNGQNVTITSSWFNSGTTIQILNYTYYPSSQERYIITGIYPSTSLVVNKPINVSLSAIKQYLVTINGESKWYNQGSKITLNANLPFYEVGEFKGTYNVPPGSTITVNEPITETLITSPNYLIIGLIVAIVAIVAVVVTVLVKRR